MGIGFPAARRLDPTLHPTPLTPIVIIITGSPDTTTGYRPAARLNDVCIPCVLPPCKPPQPKIVSSSKTVFINRLGAARVLDKVYCGAGAKPPGPGGCSHAAAKGYKTRPEDHYEEVMEVEHEASKWDDVDDYKREALDGQREKAPRPIGIVSTGLVRRAAAAIGSFFKKVGKAMAFGSSESPNPMGGGGAAKSGSVPNGSGGAMGGGSGLGAGGGKGKGPLAGGKAVDDKPEEERKEDKKLDLAFPLDLRFGSRSGSAGYAPAPNAIAFGDVTVLIG